MQRSTVAQIYGYLICLIAILLFIHSAAGIVRSSFGAPGPVAFARFRGPMHPFFGMQRWGMRGGAIGARSPASPALGLPAGPPAPFTAQRLVLHHRGPNASGLVLNVVLLIIALALGTSHWRWLQRA